MSAAAATRKSKRASSPENVPRSKRAKTDKEGRDNSKPLAETKTNARGRSKPASTNSKNGLARGAKKVAADIEDKIKAPKSTRPEKIAPPRKEKVRAPPRPKEPPVYLNALPTPPEHLRPANQIFVWGAGNFGQFGMGPDHLGEFDKPRKNPWIDEKIGSGVFGGEGAGLEAIAAGGLHTMFIDEKGTVRIV